MSTLVHSRLLCPILDLPSGARLAFADHTAEIEDHIRDELQELLEADTGQLAPLGIAIEGVHEIAPAVDAELDRLAADRAQADRVAAERAAAEENAREVEQLRDALERAERGRQAEVQAEVERRMAQFLETQRAEQAVLEPAGGAAALAAAADASPVDQGDQEPEDPAEDATIEVILGYVGEDADRADARLEMEKSRGDAARKTLVEQLVELAG